MTALQQVTEFLQNRNLPVNVMIFGLTSILSVSFHIALNSLLESYLVTGGLMSHIYLYIYIKI